MDPLQDHKLILNVVAAFEKGNLFWMSLQPVRKATYYFKSSSYCTYHHRMDIALGIVLRWLTWYTWDTQYFSLTRLRVPRSVMWQCIRIPRKIFGMPSLDHLYCYYLCSRGFDSPPTGIWMKVSERLSRRHVTMISLRRLGVSSILVPIVPALNGDRLLCTEAPTVRTHSWRGTSRTFTSRANCLRWCLFKTFPNFCFC